MSEQEIREMNELDDLAEKFGGYVCTEIPDALHYDYRKIIEYCRENGIEPLDLTIREMQSFVIQ